MAVPDYIDSIILTQIKNLSIFERILSVEDIWDSIALSKDKLSVTAKQKKSLITN